MLRLKIQQAIYDAVTTQAAAGAFKKVSYASNTGRPTDVAADSTDTLTPRTIRVNEESLTVEASSNYRRGVKYEREAWTFVLHLQFDKEVVLEVFEQYLLDNPLFVGNDTDETSEARFVVSWTTANYTHPPQGQASNGTQVTYQFVAFKIGKP